MGSRLFSNTTNLLAGHDFLNAEERAKIARILRIDVNRIPNQNSSAYDQIASRRIPTDIWRKDFQTDRDKKGVWGIRFCTRDDVDQNC